MISLVQEKWLKITRQRKLRENMSDIEEKTCLMLKWLPCLDQMVLGLEQAQGCLISGPAHIQHWKYWKKYWFSLPFHCLPAAVCKLAADWLAGPHCIMGLSPLARWPWLSDRLLHSPSLVAMWLSVGVCLLYMIGWSNINRGLLICTNLYAICSE